MTAIDNPYTLRLTKRGMTKFHRDSLRQRERGWDDYHAGKDIMAYYEATPERFKIQGRADYNLGWRAAKETAA
jgi:hypothetical protein